MFQRKKLIIDERHFKFFLKLSLLTNLIPTGVGVAALLLYSRYAQLSVVQAFCQNPVASLEGLSQWVPHTIVLLCLLNMAFITVSLLYFTNRVFGPVHNAKRKLWRLANEAEEISSVRFRKEDEFPDLEQVMNEEQRTRSLKLAAQPVVMTKRSWQQTRPF